VRAGLKVAENSLHKTWRDQGPPAPGQTFPLNCIASCNAPSPGQQFVQGQLDRYNACVNDAAEAYSGLLGTANREGSEPLNMSLGYKMAQYACVEQYPAAFLADGYDGPDPN
jgi:hypothetical protein